MSETKVLAPVKALCVPYQGVIDPVQCYADSENFHAARIAAGLRTEPRPVLIADMRGVREMWERLDGMLLTEVGRDDCIASGFRPADFHPVYVIDREVTP